MADRMTTAETAEFLGFNPQAVREFVRLGYLSAYTPSGEFGRGVRMYFDRDEVEAFKAGGAPSAQAYRAAKSKRAKAGAK